MSRRGRGVATRAIGTVVALAMVATSARFVAVLARGGETAAAQRPADPSGHKTAYVKRELFIPMRDGAKLFTIVYAPRDTSRRYPFLMTRTAYGIAPYGADEYRAVLGPNNEFAKEGYIFVYQDARGKFKSEGEFVHHVPYVRGSTRPNEATDTWDTIDWLVKNVPDNNGRVGQWGISWAGWEVSMGMIDAHPALKASSPQAPPQDQFFGDDYHSGGAYQLMYGFNWMSTNARARTAPSERPVERFDYGTPDGYQFFLDLGAAANAQKYFADSVPTWNDHMSHPTYDEYWQARNVPKDLDNVTHPVLIVASWFDAQDFYGPFRMYRAMKEKNPANKTTLVVGPWTHGGWSRADGDTLGNINFGSKTAAYYRREIELPFFNFHLKDKSPARAGPYVGADGRLNLPGAIVFETGANRWHGASEWPPKNARPRNLYLQADGKLSFTAPTDASATASDSYVSDPRKPVPYTAETTTSEGHVFMVEDQRFVAGRPDVLVYQTEPLTEDLTIAGRLEVTMHVATTGTDGDWVVKLIDVYPGDAPDPSPNPQNIRMGGFQMLLAGDILRAKFRNSMSVPEPMVPNQPANLQFSLGDKDHTFLKRHRVMIQVQSSWFPMFDRNPQTFVDIYHAKPADYLKAEHTVFRSASRPTFVTLPVVAPSRESSAPVR
jgi:putative CocE/NonD family hydrolase